MLKKKYLKPHFEKINLDSSITLVMMSVAPPDPPDPRAGSKKGNDSPFQSPFGDKPFG